MAKLRPPIESEFTFLKLEKSSVWSSPTSTKTIVKKSLSLDSLSSCLSIPDNLSISFLEDQKMVIEDMDYLVNSVKQIKICKASDNNVVCKKKIDFCNDDYDNKIVEKSSIQDDDELETEDLIERGPIRPQTHHYSKFCPYSDGTFHVRSNFGKKLLNDSLTDFDISAKEIWTDREYRQKIDICLDKLSDMNQKQLPILNSFLPTDSNLGGASIISVSLYIYIIFVCFMCFYLTH